jgi:hypothetical protein
VSYFRKVIRITAEDSPNVRRGLWERDNGLPVSNTVVVPGLLTYAEYVERRATWTEKERCIGLDGQFWEGVDDRMFPGVWLDLARKRAADLSGRRRRAVAMGVDPGEGSAFTVWVLVDELGVVARHRERTANTAVIPGRTVSLIKDHDLDPSRVLFDRGGGGREHADRLRALGYDVESVGFGEAPYLPIRRRQPLSARQDNQERHYAFKNLRAQMYWQLRQKLDPSLNPDGFGIPGEWPEVFGQLGPVPVWYDGEERLFLPPKRAKSGGKGDEVTMAKLLGCSPDDSDALVLAVHSLIHGRIRASVGVL